MKLPPRFRHLRFQLADVDTQNVTPYFNASYDFIEEARAAGHGVWRPPLVGRQQTCNQDCWPVGCWHTRCTIEFETASVIVRRLW